MAHSISSKAAVLLATALFIPTVVGAQGEGGVRTSLDSLLSIRVDAASKYSQTSAEAPASVTILTADDIARLGYRNLHEALEGVRGFYASSDRNFPYLGTRGFGRPTDYNNRILVLVDGHTLNDRTWGGTPVGTDLPVNMRAIERIEIVRGPGSVLYGTSAMFGVINIVTKTGAQLDGLRIGGEVGSTNSRGISAAGGRALGTTGSFAVSAMAARSDGEDFYFPELDSPEFNSGISRGLDWERAFGGTASLLLGDLAVRAGYRSRTKGIPTGAYGVSLTDTRAKTADETFWGEVGARREVRGVYTLSGRLFADRYDYRGVYPSGPGPAYSDWGGSTALGAEGTFAWDPTSSVRLTFGAEYVRTLRADYAERSGDGTVTSDDAPFDVLSFYLQNELQIFYGLSLVAGLRHDHSSFDGGATTPRLALIASPDSRTSLKLLYGEAFRAPSAAEAELSTTFYTENPDLRSERIRSLELEVQRRIGAPLLAGVSAYSYEIRNLIEQVEIDDAGSLQFHNAASAKAAGVELFADLSLSRVFGLNATYAVQNARDGATESRLSNSPRSVGTLALSARSAAGLSSVLALRAESGRLTIAGDATPSFVRADMNVRYSPSESSVLRRLHVSEISLRATNLFDEVYYAPAGLEHAQSAIVQNGRAVSLRLEWRY